MSDAHVIYIPDIDEPSIFTKERGVVNEIWVDYCIRRLAGNQIVRGQTAFRQQQDAVKAFLDEPLKDPNGNPISGNMLGGGVFARIVRTNGLKLQENIRKDLTLPLHPELAKPVKHMLTSNRFIKLRWVLHVCREDGMTPEEAYMYGFGLMRG